MSRASDAFLLRAFRLRRIYSATPFPSPLERLGVKVLAGALTGQRRARDGRRYGLAKPFAWGQARDTPAVSKSDIPTADSSPALGTGK